MLEVTGLRVSYGGIQAVRGITFHVNEGEMVALIGANGAGKSSTLRALARLLDPVGGSIRYRGKELVSLPPYQLVGEGIALVPEGRGVFPRMSSLENLRMGAYARNDKAEIERDLEHVLAHFPRLKERAQQIAGTLSGGEQQMLAIGRALMSKPRLMLLDEPSMGLAPIMVQKIFEVIRTVSAGGYDHSARRAERQAGIGGQSAWLRHGERRNYHHRRVEETTRRPEGTRRLPRRVVPQLAEPQ
jgi:branched-chain amino acid transport system ATP-binding protein